MIEDLTANLRSSIEPGDSSAAAGRDAWPARTVRFGTVPVLIAALLNIFQFHHATGGYGGWALWCAWFNGALAITTFSLTFMRWFPRHWRPAAFLTIAALVVSDTVLGTLGGQPKLLFISLLLLMFGTSSILPWSRRIQVVFNVLCVGAWFTQSFWVPSLDGLGAYKLMGMMTAAALSYFTCYVRDRFVLSYEESARIIRESEATLRQISTPIPTASP